MKQKKEVIVYTDGACSGNPGPGGWAAILRYKNTEKELSGGEAETTNNRMELTAAISALSCLKEPCCVELHSDSRYLVDGMEKGWAASWKRKGWKRADGSPALNPDLWDRMLLLASQHEIKYIWVKGHGTDEINNRCDSLAVAEREKFK